MKNLRLAFFSLIFIHSGSAFAAAATTDEPFTIGALLGYSTVNVQGQYIDASDVGSPDPHYQQRKTQAPNAIFFGSYLLNENWILEMQLAPGLQSSTLFRGMTLESGEVSNMRMTNSAAGFYGVYQAGHELYMRLKFGLGFAMADIETDESSETFSRAGISYGISVGREMGPGALEFMYMRYPDISVERSSFQDTFALASAGNESSVQTRRRLKYNVLSVGYVYNF